MGYKEMMEKSYWFKHYGITPLWDPDDSEIHAFIHDEVVRQGHNTKLEDGQQREHWMYLAWWYALEASEKRSFPNVDDIIHIGKLIEPEMNRANGFRLHNVYIGQDTGAPPGLIDMMMIRLVSRSGAISPEMTMDFYEPDHTDFRRLWKYMRESGIDPSISMVDSGGKPIRNVARGSGHSVLMDRFGELVNQLESPDAWYLCFEAIHPFADGNGRTGKILHNWLKGTLHKPVLVEDFFGGGNP